MTRMLRPGAPLVIAGAIVLLALLATCSLIFYHS